MSAAPLRVGLHGDVLRAQPFGTALCKLAHGAVGMSLCLLNPPKRIVILRGGKLRHADIVHLPIGDGELIIGIGLIAILGGAYWLGLGMGGSF